MAYISLLSLIPSLAAIFSLIGLFSPLASSDSSLISGFKNFILSHLASASGQLVINYLEVFIDNLNFKKIGITGFIGTFVSLILLLKKIEIAFNNIFQTAKTRGLITRFVYFWTFLTLGTFSLTLIIGTITQLVGNNVDASPILGVIANELMMLVFFSLLYKLVPNRQVSGSHAICGGLFTSTTLTLAGSGLKQYVLLFGNYEAIYGAAMAAMPVFLLWLYTAWYIILLGALLTYNLRNLHHIKASNFDRIDKFSYNYYTEAIMKQKLPFIISSMIVKSHEAHCEGGLKESEIYATIPAPAKWIEEAILLLLSKKLILSESAPKNQKILFPRRPNSFYSETNLQSILNEIPSGWDEF